MAIPGLDSRFGGRYVDVLVPLVGRWESVAPPFRISRCIHLHRGSLAYSSGSPSDPGIDAPCRARRGRNGDAAWNSRASRRQSYSREQRSCRRERGLQRNSFIADVALDQPALRRSETILSITTPDPRRLRRCYRASWEFPSRGFSGPDCRDRKSVRGQSLARHCRLQHHRVRVCRHPGSRILAREIPS